MLHHASLSPREAFYVYITNIPFDFMGGEWYNQT